MTTDRIEIQNAPFVGTLFSPKDKTNLPAVLVLPGSDGGIPESLAKWIAEQGYVTLALGYFGMAGLPENLENIPLEYFQKPIEFLRSLPQVKSDSVVLMGYSRGGELALLLGSLFPGIANGIIAYVPSSHVCGGFPHPNRPAWLLNNQPLLPFLGGLMNKKEDLTEAEDLRLASEKGVIPYHSNTLQDPYLIVDLFLARDKDLTSCPIPVEKITCPLLLISAELDLIWPSALFAKAIMDRLDQQGSPIERKSLVYPNAGHGVMAPYEGAIYHPVGKFWCTLGGTPAGNKLANQSAWKETFTFLKTYCN